MIITLLEFGADMFGCFFLLQIFTRFVCFREQEGTGQRLFRGYVDTLATRKCFSALSVFLLKIN